jgi:Fe-S-cluster containining protein
MSLFPDTEPPRADISCENCTAACCRAGVNLAMSKREAVMVGLKITRKVHIRAEPGFRRVQLEPSEWFPNGLDADVPPDIEFSTLTADCGHLAVDNTCTIYDNPEKPQACSSFVVGSKACLYARELVGFVD